MWGTELYPTHCVVLSFLNWLFPLLRGRNTEINSPNTMNINQVREQLHRLIDEVDDLYVLNGLYRNLVADKRQREAYEQEQAKKQARPNKSTR